MNLRGGGETQAESQGLMVIGQLKVSMNRKAFQVEGTKYAKAWRYQTACQIQEALILVLKMPSVYGASEGVAKEKAE